MHETLRRDPSGYRQREGVAGEKDKGRKA